LLLLAGCNHLRPFPNGGGEQQAARPPAQPTAESLVAYLNDNARRIQSLDCGELHIDVHAQGQEFSLVDCWIVCQKPRNFRMMARVAGGQEVDLGSNSGEFWWWIKRGDPYLFHCSYEDLARSRLRIPIQPEWIMQGFGMAEYGPAENFTVNATPQTVELIEQTKSPHGEPMRKVTVFSRRPARTNAPVVTAHILQDGNGKVLCGAYVTAVQQDAATGAVVPTKVRLEWPQENMKLEMTLKKITVNKTFTEERTAVLFGRPQMPGVATYDLARGPDQGQAIRRMSGPPTNPR
jgi:hypothetical protein